MCGYMAFVPEYRGSIGTTTLRHTRSSLMMADYCRNMEPVYRIKEWYISLHSVGYFYYIVSITFCDYV
jgi:hypothetical protein